MGFSKSSRENVRAVAGAYPVACGLVRLRMEGFRMPNRPKRVRGIGGPGLGATVTAAAPEAASCSRTEALRRLETAEKKH